LKKTDNLPEPSGLELAKAETIWMFREFVRRGRHSDPDPLIGDLTWENANPENKVKEIAKWTIILATLASSGVTAEALAKADLNWENQHIVSHSPEFVTLLATWESHSQGWRDQELAKWSEILAAARLAMMGRNFPVDESAKWPSHSGH
jgi:hypothetical protein